MELRSQSYLGCLIDQESRLPNLANGWSFLRANRSPKSELPGATPARRFDLMESEELEKAPNFSAELEEWSQGSS